MKKLLVAFLIGSLFVLALVTTALADNQPHGNFSPTTDACAGCHRVHTAQYGSNALLKTASEKELCMSCHDGTGAATNVKMGVYQQAKSPWGYTEGVDGGSLFGGGFTNAKMATSWSGSNTYNAAFNAISRPVSSKHPVDSNGQIYGSGAHGNPSPANDSMIIECVSCHDPHGSAGYVYNATTKVWDKTASYRLLRWQPQGSNGYTPPATSVNWSGGAFPDANPTGTANTGWLVPDNFAANGSEWYTIFQDDTAGNTLNFALGDYNASSNANQAYKPNAAHNYVPAAVNVAFFCAQCHDRYFNSSRLRNNTDYSVRCNTGVAPPVDGTSVHPTDPTCVPAYTAGAIRNTLPPYDAVRGWYWADNGPSGDSLYAFRHTSGDIRESMDHVYAAGTGAEVSRTCVACHVAHGTSANSTSFASGATLSGSAALLRMDNRSVCLRCHASAVNFTVAP